MPPRWDHNDVEQPPEGFTKVGYDADEQIHYFRDREGNYWQSEPGTSSSSTGELRPCDSVPSSSLLPYTDGAPTDETIRLLGPSRTNQVTYYPNQSHYPGSSYDPHPKSTAPLHGETWRGIAPFALCCLTFMAVMIWYVRSPSTSVWTGHDN